MRLPRSSDIGKSNDLFDRAMEKIETELEELKIFKESVLNSREFKSCMEEE